LPPGESPVERPTSSTDNPLPGGPPTDSAPSLPPASRASATFSRLHYFSMGVACIIGLFLFQTV
jgi:hypothetical protein